MMKIILFILLSLTSYLYSQESILGFYESSLDIYWTGHTRLYLQLKSDSTYTFGFWDDTQREKTDGVWSRENDILFLKPSKIPPKIVIDYKYDRKNKSPFNEFIVVGINDSAIGKVNYILYTNSSLFQDSLNLPPNCRQEEKHLYLEKI